MPDPQHTFDDGVAAYCYRIDDAGNARIESCRTHASSIVIPDTLDSHPVAAIGASAFAHLTKTRSIRCADGITSIGHLAFEQCHALESIVFPSELAQFDVDWLAGCKRLTRIVLPGKAATVSGGLFNDFCVREVTIGPHLRTIEIPRGKLLELECVAIHPGNPWLSTDGTGLYAEGGDVILTLTHSVDCYEIAPGCKRIGAYAFAHRKELAAVTVPDTVTEVDNLAFLDCGICSFDAPPALTRIGDRAFMGCRALARATLNEGLVELGEYAFARTDALQELRVPKTVRTLGTSFAGTPEELGRRAEPVRLEAGNPHLLMDNCRLIYRRSSNGLTLVNASCFTEADARPLPGTVEIGDSVFKGHRFVRTAHLPEGVKRIAGSAFRECSQLEHVYLPSTLEEIGDLAFFGSSLESAHIPAGCTRIGQRALDTTARRTVLNNGRKEHVLCTSMRSLTIEEGNPTHYASGGMVYRREADGRPRAMLYVGPNDRVSIPPEVTSIDAYAFCGATGIEELRLHEGIDDLGAGALYPSEPFARISITLAQPTCGQGAISVDMPSGQLGMNILRRSLYHIVDAQLFMECYDAAIPHDPDHFLRYKRMVERLANPVFMADWARDIFLRDLTLNPEHVCVVFAKRDWLVGLEALATWKIIDDRIMEAVIDKLAGNPTTVTSVAKLIELKRIHYPDSMHDFEL